MFGCCEIDKHMDGDRDYKGGVEVEWAVSQDVNLYVIMGIECVKSTSESHMDTVPWQFLRHTTLKCLSNSCEGSQQAK